MNRRQTHLRPLHSEEHAGGVRHRTFAYKPGAILIRFNDEISISECRSAFILSLSIGFNVQCQTVMSDIMSAPFPRFGFPLENHEESSWSRHSHCHWLCARPDSRSAPEPKRPLKRPGRPACPFCKRSQMTVNYRFVHPSNGFNVPNCATVATAYPYALRNVRCVGSDI